MELEKTDIVQYLFLIRQTWNDAYKTDSKEEESILANFWFEVLKPYPKEVVNNAFMNAIRTSKFYVKPADIIGEIEKMREALIPTELELWKKLFGACERWGRLLSDLRNKYQNDYLNEQEEKAQQDYDGLSAEIRKYWVKSFIDFLKYANEVDKMDETSLSVEKSNFIKFIAKCREKEKIKETMSEEVKGLLGGASCKLVEEKIKGE